MANYKVTTRVFELQEAARERCMVNVEGLLSNTKVTLRVMELQEAEDAAETQPPKLACHH